MPVTLWVAMVKRLPLPRMVLITDMIVGAHSWVRKAMGISMDGEQTGQSTRIYYILLFPLRYSLLDDIWGVIDVLADTDLPDIRNKCAIHSTVGSIKTIPREDDKVRYYIQLPDSSVLDPVTGRVDKGRMTSEKLIEVRGSARRVLSRSDRCTQRLLGGYSIPTSLRSQERSIGGRFTSVGALHETHTVSNPQHNSRTAGCIKVLGK